MDALVIESDNSYEPDCEDLAYERQKEIEFESLLQKYDDLDQRLCDSNRTDRLLRNMYKERNAIARKLSRRWQFDVTTDTFEVLDHELEHLDFIPREGHPRKGFNCDDSPGELSRRNKRRAKTEQRRATRKLRIWRAQWEKSRAASVVRKTGALAPLVAGKCHA